MDNVNVHIIFCRNSKTDQISYIKLIMPNYRDKGWYVQVGSFNAFFNAYKPHLIRHQDRHLHYRAERYDEKKREWERLQGRYKKSDIKDVRDYYSVPFDKSLGEMVTVNGMWDFYDYINFDYKKKRYKHDTDGSQIREVRKWWKNYLEKCYPEKD